MLVHAYRVACGVLMAILTVSLDMKIKNATTNQHGARTWACSRIPTRRATTPNSASGVTPASGPRFLYPDWRMPAVGGEPRMVFVMRISTLLSVDSASTDKTVRIA
jgi:hypothetical protein